MIKKLEKQNTWGECLEKLNELVDAVNAIQKEREAERFEIQEWIGILETVRKSVNVHEKQIDELQMKLEPEKCETRAENVHPDTESGRQNVQDQTKWIGKLCKFRDKYYKDDQWDYGLLQAIENAETALIWKTGCFKHNLGHWYDICEPVSPDDDIIYKKEQQ